MKKLERFLYSPKISFIVIFILMLDCCNFEPLPKLDLIIKAMGAMIGTLVLLFYLLNCKISKFSVGLIIYCSLTFISTLLGEKSDIVLFFTTYYRIICLVFYLDYGFRYYFKNIVFNSYIIYFILIIINLYTILKYPGGWNIPNHSFFWHDNCHISMYLPAIMFIILNKKINNNKFKIMNYSLIIMITFSILYTFSATTFMAYLAFLFYILFKSYINKVEIFNVMTYFFTYIVLFFSILVFKIQNLFSILIVDILGKTLTISGRTYIWKMIMGLIKERPFLGYGKEDAALVASKLGHPAFTSAHNTILDVIYKGGIVGLISFIYLLFLPMNKLYINRKNEISKLLSVFIFCFLIITLFEARQEDIGLYVILVSSFHVESIIKNIEEIKS